MTKLSHLVWMFVIVVAAFMLYKVKYQVQALKTQVADTARELEGEREALHVAAAEWAYLNRPQRLQQLANKYLVSSAGVTVDQVAEIEAIPFPGQMQASIDAEEGIHPASVTMSGGAGAR